MRSSLSLLWIGLLLLTGLACAETDEAAEAPADAAPEATATDEWITLYDGSGTEGWEMTGPGSFRIEEDGSMTSQGGMGLYYYKDLQLKNFILELEWKSTSETANSGVFVRFPEAPDPWYAVNTGYEIQIDDSQDPMHQTGSVYSFSPPTHVASKPLGEWNHYRIEVRGQHYQIYLNGEKVNDFQGDRSEAGMVGLQNHDDNSEVSFRNIRVKPLPDEAS